MYLLNGDDHANQWRSTNLNQKGNMSQYGIRCVVGRKKLDDTQSSITKCVILVIHVHSWITSTYKKTSLRRRSMRTSKYKKVWAGLNDLKEAPLGDHDKLTNRSSSRCVSRKWIWSCNSMKIYKSQPKGKYALVWHQMYGRSKESNDIRSSIIKCAISIIHIHNWIGSIHQRNVSQKKKHDDI